MWMCTHNAHICMHACVCMCFINMAPKIGSWTSGYIGCLRLKRGSLEALSHHMMNHAIMGPIDVTENSYGDTRAHQGHHKGYQNHSSILMGPQEHILLDFKVRSIVQGPKGAHIESKL